MPEQADRLDRKLDAALASYAQAPETEGLERRVLAAATRPTKRVFFPALPWAVAACMAAAGCWLFWQPLQFPVQKQVAIKSHPVSSKIAKYERVPAPLRHFATASTHITKPRRAFNKSGEPKLLQFPAAAPLTNQERALLRLAASGQILISREWTLGSSIEPLQLKPLEIKPLE